MKIWSGIFSVFGFIFQYIIPIILFGNVIPYTHESLEAGITAMGYLAIAVIVIICSKRLKKKLGGMQKGLFRALMLSLFPVAYWLLIKVGLDYLLRFVVALSQYWGHLIIFIVIGRLFFVLAELFCEKEVEKNG